LKRYIDITNQVPAVEGTEVQNYDFAFLNDEKIDYPIKHDTYID
jgi:hypothetical protein